MPPAQETNDLGVAASDNEIRPKGLVTRISLDHYGVPTVIPRVQTVLGREIGTVLRARGSLEAKHL